MSGDIYDAIRLAKQGDREAAERLVEENSGLIWSVARSARRRGNTSRSTCRCILTAGRKNLHLLSARSRR